MPGATLARKIRKAIEARIELNMEKCNFAPITLSISKDEMKEYLAKGKLYQVTRLRCMKALTKFGYQVTWDATNLVLIVEVNPLDRTNTFESLEDLELSLES